MSDRSVSSSGPQFSVADRRIPESSSKRQPPLGSSILNFLAQLQHWPVLSYDRGSTSLNRPSLSGQCFNPTGEKSRFDTCVNTAANLLTCAIATHPIADVAQSVEREALNLVVAERQLLGASGNQQQRHVARATGVAAVAQTRGIFEGKRGILGSSATRLQDTQQQSQQQQGHREAAESICLLSSQQHSIASVHDSGSDRYPDSAVAAATGKKRPMKSRLVDLKQHDAKVLAVSRLPPVKRPPLAVLPQCLVAI
ncbi:hypothetical protein EPH_0054440 [Eimeria praecox]|uniref:Uncharacterized protein n=1 Tax=Eimeria praecox TaxID=51316 RepID=U6H5A5_9EIME|nr:hypothetical protein EPH_0054440 [Eimeria praecox]